MPLALLRIALGVLILLSPEAYQTRSLAAGPEALLIAPVGLGWLPKVLSWLSPYLQLVHWLMNLACVSLIVGLFCRTSAFIVATTFVLMFGGAQLSGTVTHDMHLLWLLLVLLFAPKHDALSVDAWLQKRPLWFAQPSRHAHVSVLTARVLLGCVYFFPGLAKLTTQGLNFADSDNLINQMRIKWFLAGGQVPWPRVDEYPTLITVGGLLVLGFELGFLALVFTRVGRVCVALMGLSFHLATSHFFYIPFPSLWGCYGVLWDGPRASAAPAAEPRARERVAALVGFVLVALVATAGFGRQTQAWPFACYPDFAARAPNHVWDIAVDVERADGAPITLRAARRRGSHKWGTVWKILGLYDGKSRPDALDAYAQRLIHSTLNDEPIRGFTVLAEQFSIAPEHYSAPPLQRRRMYRAAKNVMLGP